MKHLLCAKRGARLMGDSSDQVSQSPMPTLDDTVQRDGGTQRKTQVAVLSQDQGATQLEELGRVPTLAHPSARTWGAEEG